MYSTFEPVLPHLRWVIPVMAALAAIGFAALRGRGPHFARGLCWALLCMAALLSAINYNKEQWRLSYYLNAYEFFHYYLGAKYAPELGYNGLYSAALLALKESGRRDLPPAIRNLKTEGTMNTQQGLEQGAEFKRHFSETRWTEFKQDVNFFRGRFRTASAWNKMMTDKGYNAPPVWTMIGGALAETVPVSNLRGMHALALLDAALVTLGVLAIALAFNVQAALLTVILLGSTYVTTSPTLHAAFLRYDWLVALVLAACCLRKQWFLSAGMLAAYAASVRVFPVLFVLGPAVLGAVALLRERKLHPGWLRFGLGFAGCAAVLVLASILWTGGLGAWREFAEKIAGHNDDLSAWRVGFKYVFLMHYGPANAWLLPLAGPMGNFWGIPDAQVLVQHAWTLRAIQFAAILLFALACLRLHPDEAFLFGFVPVFFLSASTYYYYAMLILPLIFFAAQPDRWPRLIGILGLLASGMIAHRLADLYDRSYPLFFWVSVMAMLVALYLLLCALARFLPRRIARSGAMHQA